ncbi:antibiotic biosynthesis monooxygenase [Streptomyces purpurogeneiscleroticus]|uniref:antibiotic biosynthesis monooxygenase n=1 Tax=Streptomyces purpurogeneiscleroticus TaxID=68259 RepID=UPI001CBE4E13|nr:antibiotic biosynthesis monooxygenase [Streptomyces purpurogeneiscleroticus]MBZ4015347.1 hypothetical protein [Streptomyces purpurogeneiscleroticus]
MLCHPTLPDIRHAGTAAVFVSHWYVPDRTTALKDLDEVTAAWETAEWPADILSFSSYLSTDGNTVLTYAQCASAAAYRPFTRALTGPASAEAVEYRLYRSFVPDGATADAPGCVVAATFDTDGPLCQRNVVEQIVATVGREGPHAKDGLLATHFHTSVDGTRVLNYAEWTTDEAHETFLRDACSGRARASYEALPGVRPIGYTRYHLHHSAVRP